MFSDAYTAGESQVNMGIAYSSASLVISVGCKVNTSNDECHYTKIGNRIFLSGSIGISSVSSPSGRLTINNKPFDKLPRSFWKSILSGLNINSQLRWADISKIQKQSLIKYLTM